jgi:hypothetical protein
LQALRLAGFAFAASTGTTTSSIPQSRLTGGSGLLRLEPPRPSPPHAAPSNSWKEELPKFCGCQRSSTAGGGAIPHPASLRNAAFPRKREGRRRFKGNCLRAASIDRDRERAIAN